MSTSKPIEPAALVYDGCSAEQFLAFDRQVKRWLRRKFKGLTKYFWDGEAPTGRPVTQESELQEPPTDICSNGHMAVTGLGSIRIQGYVLGGFEILRQLDLCAHEDLQVLAKSGGYRCHQDPLGRS